MPRETVLTESERCLVASALRIAAEQYNSDAHIAAAEGHPRIATSFDQQERDARRLADLIEDSDAVKVVL